MHLSSKPLAAERMVGLDIGSQSVSASLIGFGMHKAITLEAAGNLPINISDNDASISKAIRKLWKQSGFASYTVCACLQSTSVIFKHFSKPDLTKTELKDSLQLDAEEVMQVPPDKMAIDIHLLSNSDENPAPKADSCEGFYVAALKSDVDRLLQILDQAGLFPAIIDVSCMAAANAFLRLNPLITEKPVCFACINSQHADIVILQNNECKYSRSVTAHGSDSTKTSDYMAEVIIEVIKQSHLVVGNDPISKIYLSGITSETGEIEKIYKIRTGLPVELWNPLDHIPISHHLEHIWRGKDKVETGMHLVRSLGLALRREG